MALFWVRRIHVCVRTTGWPVSSRECKMMSCDFTCPAVIYLTPVSARFCLASGYQFAIVQEETGREWALNTDFRHRPHNIRAYCSSCVEYFVPHSIQLWRNVLNGIRQRKENRAPPPLSAETVSSGQLRALTVRPAREETQQGIFIIFMIQPDIEPRTENKYLTQWGSGKRQRTQSISGEF